MIAALTDYLSEKGENTVDVTMSMFSGGEVLQFDAGHTTLTAVAQKEEVGSLFADMPAAPAAPPADETPAGRGNVPQSTAVTNTGDSTKFDARGRLTDEWLNEWYEHTVARRDERTRQFVAGEIDSLR